MTKTRVYQQQITFADREGTPAQVIESLAGMGWQPDPANTDDKAAAFVHPQVTGSRTIVILEPIDG